MSAEHPGIDVRHNAAASRFETEIDAKLCSASYHLVDGVMRMNHTAVPPALEGRGVAAALVRAAFAHADANGLMVEPWCSYVRTYMKRHPETHRFLTPGFKL